MSKNFIKSSKLKNIRKHPGFFKLPFKSGFFLDKKRREHYL